MTVGNKSTNIYKIIVSCKIGIARRRPFARAFLLQSMKFNTYFCLLFTVLLLVFVGMLTIYSGHFAILSNVSLQKCYFQKYYYFTDHVYVQLPWFLKRAVAEALKLQKMTVTFRHKFFTGLIFDIGFSGVFLVF